MPEAMTDRGSACLWNREGHLPSEVVLPVYLLGFLPPEILRKTEARCKPLPGLAVLLPTTQGGGLGPACPTEGTWDPSPSHHVLRLGKSALGMLC